MPVHYLSPGEGFTRPVHDDELPLGAILVADLQDELPALARAVESQLESPWCPLVLRLTDHRITARVLATFEPYSGAFALLRVNNFVDPSPADRILTAVRGRPVPSAWVVAGYVCRRLELPVDRLIYACAGRSDAGGMSPRTLSRRIGELGPFEVRDWRGLIRLCRLAAMAEGHRSAALEAAALDAGSDPRSARRWLNRLAGVSWPEVRQLAGWEWVIEAALRRGRYLRPGPAFRRMAGRQRQRAEVGLRASA